jgi:uncharacterized damage-inducible protein DinB
MHASLIPINEIIKLNTRLLINSLKDVNNDLAGRRISNNINSITFITCHILDARYYLTNLIGYKIESPFKELFDKINSIDELTDPPSIDDLKNSWLEISKTLEYYLPKVNDEILLRESKIKFPDSDKSILGSITFFVEHESYHIGQISLLRKFFNLPAMKYY